MKYFPRSHAPAWERILSPKTPPRISKLIRPSYAGSWERGKKLKFLAMFHPSPQKIAVHFMSHCRVVASLLFVFTLLLPSGSGLAEALPKAMEQMNEVIDKRSAIFSKAQGYARDGDVESLQNLMLQHSWLLTETLWRYRVEAGRIGAEIPFANEFIKVSQQGEVLPKTARDWSCVADAQTGLLWEVKTQANKDKEYRWGGRGVSTTALRSKNGANRYDQESWDGDGRRYNDWNELLDEVNGKKLCGYDDWRVPTLYELATLVQCKGGRYENLDGGCEGNYQRPTIDTDFFPNTVSSWFWSSSPYANFSIRAWTVYFGHGYGNYGNRSFNSQVRLVRSSQ